MPTIAQSEYHERMRKLTPEQKTLARNLYTTSVPKPTMQQLADYFGVSKTVMFKALRSHSD